MCYNVKTQTFSRTKRKHFFPSTRYKYLAGWASPAVCLVPSQKQKRKKENRDMAWGEKKITVALLNADGVLLPWTWEWSEAWWLALAATTIYHGMTGTAADTHGHGLAGRAGLSCSSEPPANQTMIGRWKILHLLAETNKRPSLWHPLFPLCLWHRQQRLICFIY